MAQSPREPWCVAGLDLPLGVLPRDSHLQPAAPGAAPAILGGPWFARREDPLAGCWEGSNVQGGECKG